MGYETICFQEPWKLETFVYLEIFFPGNINNIGNSFVEGFKVVLSCWSCFNLSRPNHGRREKVDLNLYFHTSLWCLKRFYEVPSEVP